MPLPIANISISFENQCAKYTMEMFTKIKTFREATPGSKFIVFVSEVHLSHVWN